MKKDYEYLSDEHAEYIKNLIKEVEKKDKNYEILGQKCINMNFVKQKVLSG